MPTEEEIRQLFAVHTSAFTASERLLRSYGLDATRQWVGDGGYRLSDSVWRARKQTRDQIDAVLRQAIADGTDALEVARILEDHLNPSLSPIRNERGRLVRNIKRNREATLHNRRPIIATRSPGRAGMGSFPARRLARTEITRAHGAATMWAAERTPFAVGVKWSTSGRHPKPDECDAKAERDTGLGAGVYAVNDVPRYPSHPQCLCNLSTATTDDVDTVVAGLQDKYRLGETGVAEQRIKPSSGKQKPATPTQQLESLGFENVVIEKLSRRFASTNERTNQAVPFITDALAALRDLGVTMPRALKIGDALGPNVPAYFDPKRQLLSFRTGSSSFDYRNPAGTTKQLHDSGMWSTAAPEHIVQHEVAHWLHFDETKIVDRTIPDATTRSGFREVKDDRYMARTWDSPADERTAMSVSRYGATQPAEFVAEAWTLMLNGGSLTDEAAALYRRYRGPMVPRKASP